MGTTQHVSINNAAASTDYFQDEQKTTTKRTLSAMSLWGKEGDLFNMSLLIATIKHNRFPKGSQSLCN